MDLSQVQSLDHGPRDDIIFSYFLPTHTVPVEDVHSYAPHPLSPSPSFISHL